MSLPKRAAPQQVNILKRVEDVVNMVDEMADNIGNYWELKSSPCCGVESTSVPKTQFFFLLAYTN